MPKEHAIIATIYEYQEEYYSAVFQDDRLIYPSTTPPPTPENGYHTREQAIAFLRHYYPDIPLMNNQEFREAYQALGYYKPNSNSLLTWYLCVVCGANIKLSPRSRNAGWNAPYGSLVNTWYDCPECNTIYNCQSQERQFGTSYEWSYKPEEAVPYIDCDEPPTMPKVNPFGFEEKRLGEKKEWEEEDAK